MTNVNQNQLRVMAQEIVNLLDQKEQTDSTKGDNQIEASIWNQFVGKDQPKEKQIGNGEKSFIEHRIPFKNAIGSIASYIRNKGTATIKEALNNINMEWNPSIEVEANSNISQEQKPTDSKDKMTIGDTVIDLKKLRDYDKSVKKKYERVEQLKNSVMKKVYINGKSTYLSYKEIVGQLFSFRERYSILGVVHDKTTGKPRFPKLSEIHEHLKAAVQNKKLEDVYKKHDIENLKELESLLSAKHELEREYPEFKNCQYTVWNNNGEEVYLEGSLGIIESFIDE